MSNKNLEEVFVTKNIPEAHPPNVQSPYKMKTDYLHLGKHTDEWEDGVLVNSSFVPRWLAEKDDSIVQFIPYVVCCNSDGDILTYYRKGGGEGRLEGKKSIGIGGHVNDSDVEIYNKTPILTWDIILKGAAREIWEELDVSRSMKIVDNLVEIGIIYTPLDGQEDATLRKTTSIPPVGAVHLGIVYMLEVPSEITIKDDEGMINPEFMKISATKKELDKYETWSRMILETLIEMKKENKK